MVSSSLCSHGVCQPLARRIRNRAFPGACRARSSSLWVGLVASIVCLALAAAPLHAGPDTGKLHPELKELGNELEYEALNNPPSYSEHSSFSKRVNNQGEVQVYISVDNTDAQTINDLTALGFKVDIADSSLKLIQGWLPFQKFQEVQTIAAVRSIRTPDYAVPRTGSVNSQGDAILNADDVRAKGFIGTGVKVGVISDGATNRQSAINSGNLPASIEIPVGFAGSGDEGTAMLEIVHDLAPGASLAFAGVRTSLEMLNAISALRNINCKIIVDDLGFFGEPFFEDGPIAQAAQAAVNAGVFYTSSAGNESQVHYEANFSGLGSRNIPGRTLIDAHDFGGGDFLCRISASAGTTITVVLQWNNLFGSSGDDYDIFLVSADGTQQLDSSRDFQNGNDIPIEVLQFGPVAVNTLADIAIERFSGSSNVRLEFFLLPSSLQLTEFGVPGGAIFGHPAALGVFAAGAISANDPGNDTVESFSSQGPSLIVFPSQVNRNKPEACAIDGVSVSGAGGFPSPFFGTSAASPHVAAVAALLKSAISLTPAQITTALQNNAVDINTQGYDLVSGSGRIDALAAINTLVGTTLLSVSFSPNPVGGGGSTTGTVALDRAVIGAPVVVTLQSSDQNIAPVPSSVTINEGQSSASFTVPTLEVQAVTSVTVIASSGGVTVSTILILTIPNLDGLALNPIAVLGGQAATGTVTLTGPAPSFGIVVSLTSTSPGTAPVPSTVMVAGQTTTANFTITTTEVGLPEKVTISASVGNITKTGALDVNVSGGTASGGGGGCFIATAAYGSAFEPRVRCLAAFRDSRLQPSELGADFTSTYYAHALPPAALLRSSASLRALSRKLLRPAFDAAR